MATFLEIGLCNALAAGALALVALGVSRVGRRPALSHALWVLVLVKLVTPPLVPIALPWPAEKEEPSSVSAAAPEPVAVATAPAIADPAPAVEPTAVEGPNEDQPEPPSPEPAAAPFPWLRWLGAIWLAGSALWLARTVFHLRCFRRLLRHALPAPAELQAEAVMLARRLGLRRCPDVRLVCGVVPPMAWGLGRSRCILFPSGLLDRLDGEGRSALLAHELAHLRRRDHLVRLLEMAATGLYWWNPVLWWARREIHEAEEQCCDAWAVWALGGESRPYALALLQAVAFVSRARLSLPVGASGIGHVSHLRRRLAMILHGKTSRSLSWTGLAAVLVPGLLLLPLFPAQGQVPAPPSTPAVGASRDDQIEALKKAIQYLQDQQNREKPSAQPPRNRDVAPGVAPATPLRASDDAKLAAEDLHAVLLELEKKIDVRRKELQDLETKALVLQDKLKHLDAERYKRAERTAPGDAGKPGTAPPPAVRYPGAPVRQPSEVEKKLERLQKELDELRRELHREKPAESLGRVGF